MSNQEGPRVHEVFITGGLPSYTYVSRDSLKLEQTIATAIERGHSFTVVTGPSKSGKTTLCRKVLGNADYVLVEGAHIRTEAEFWLHIAHDLNVASSVTRGKAATSTDGRSASASFQIKSILKLESSRNHSSSDQRTVSQSFNNVMIVSAIRKLLSERKSLIVDDFHFIEPESQTKIIRALKSAVFDGLSVFLLAVPHRAFDVLSAEADIEGRNIPVSIPSWSHEDLFQITKKGFEALNVDVRDRIQGLICNDGYGSPLLVQEICADFCGKNKIKGFRAEKQIVDENLLADTYREISERKASPKIVKLRAGPETARVKGTRKMRGGGSENIYTAILFAVARLGPEPFTTYEELRKSLRAVYDDGVRMPSKREITIALSQISAIARDDIPGDPVLEWLGDQETVVITDPFLLFYLRFTLRDQGMVRLPVSAPALVTL